MAIEVYLSGGATNADNAAALGGVISSTQYGAAGGPMLFAPVRVGTVYYRCLYVKNTADTLDPGKVFIYSAGISTIYIGLGTADVSASEQSVANQTTAPTGVTFGTNPTGLALPSLGAGAYKAVWIKVAPSAVPNARGYDEWAIHVAGTVA